jgi:hypothetical protein
MGKISISIPDKLIEKMDIERGLVKRSSYISNLILISETKNGVCKFNLDDIEGLLERKFEELKR